MINSSSANYVERTRLRSSDFGESSPLQLRNGGREGESGGRRVWSGTLARRGSQVSEQPERAPRSQIESNTMTFYILLSAMP